MISIMRRLLSLIFSTFLISGLLQAMDSLEESVAHLMNVKSNQISLKKQTKGMSSAQNYSFELDGEKYIFKVFGKNKNRKYRKREIDVTKTFSDLGLGAKFVASGGEDSIYIREYIPGKILSQTDLQDEKVVTNLAKSRRKLHTCKGAEPAKSLLERTRKHCTNISKKKIAVPTGFEKSFEKFQEIYGSLSSLDGFCHNDLNPHNILLTKESDIYFIDLGNAGNSNIYVELGYVTILNGITGEKLEEFLEKYYGKKPSQEDLGTVKLAQKLVCFASACVYFDFSESKKDKEIDIKTRTENLDKLLESGDLETMQSMIKNGEVPSVKSKRKDLVKKYAVACYKQFLEM